MEAHRIAELRREILGSIEQLSTEVQKQNEDAILTLLAISVKSATAIHPQKGNKTLARLIEEGEAWPTMVTTSPKMTMALQSPITKLLGNRAVESMNFALSHKDADKPVRVIPAYLHMILSRCRQAAVFEAMLWKTANAPADSSAKSMFLDREEWESIRRQCLIEAMALLDLLRKQIGAPKANLHPTAPEKIQIAAAGLPPWDQAAASVWFELGWKIILALTLEKPQHFPKLRSIGIYKGLTAAKIREGILTRMQQSFKSLGRRDNRPHKKKKKSRA